MIRSKHNVCRKVFGGKACAVTSKKKINAGWWCEGDKQIWKEAKVFALNEVTKKEFEAK